MAEDNDNWRNQAWLFEIGTKAVISAKFVTSVECKFNNWQTESLARNSKEFFNRTGGPPLDALVSALSLTKQWVPHPFRRSSFLVFELRRKGWVYHELSLWLDYHDLPCHEDYAGFTVVVTATSSHVPVPPAAVSQFGQASRPSRRLTQMHADEWRGNSAWVKFPGGERGQPELSCFLQSFEPSAKWYSRRRFCDPFLLASFPALLLRGGTRAASGCKTDSELFLDWPQTGP